MEFSFDLNVLISQYRLLGLQLSLLVLGVSNTILHHRLNRIEILLQGVNGLLYLPLVCVKRFHLLLVIFGQLCQLVRLFLSCCTQSSHSTVLSAAARDM